MLDAQTTLGIFQHHQSLAQKPPSANVRAGHKRAVPRSRVSRCGTSALNVLREPWSVPFQRMHREPLACARVDDKATTVWIGSPCCTADHGARAGTRPKDVSHARPPSGTVSIRARPSPASAQGGTASKPLVPFLKRVLGGTCWWFAVTRSAAQPRTTGSNNASHPHHHV